MGLVRKTDLMLDPPKKPRKKHKVTPIVGENGRFMVDSHSMADRGKEGAYVVDIFEEEETVAHGKVIGTCPCKGFSVRGTCSHLADAREEYDRIIAAGLADEMGLENLDDKG